MNQDTTHRRTVIAGLAALAAAPAAAQVAPPPSKAVVDALAPSGRLRAATNASNPVLATRDAASGAVSGVTVDISNELGRRLGVPVDIIFYTDGTQELPGLAIDHWDVGLLGIDPVRADLLAFTPAYLLLEATYMVAQNSPLRSAPEVDKAGVRIASGASSAYDMILTREVKQAQIVRGATTAAGMEAYLAGGYDALAGVRQMLDILAAQHPGYRVLPGNYGAIAQGLGIPHSHEAGLPYLSAFVEDIKASGFVRASLDRHGQTSAIVAPARKG